MSLPRVWISDFHLAECTKHGRFYLERQEWGMQQYVPISELESTRDVLLGLLAQIDKEYRGQEHILCNEQSYAAIKLAREAVALLDPTKEIDGSN